MTEDSSLAKNFALEVVYTAAIVIAAGVVVYGVKRVARRTNKIVKSVRG